MHILTKNKLRKKVITTLRKQGYQVSKTTFLLNQVDREKKRDVHALAKIERINKRKQFIVRNVKLIKNSLVDGDELSVEKIKPTLIEVKPNTEWEILFRWWNLVWWSLPYERA